MQLFLFLNDLAGRFPPLDALARWFYIGAVPLLATLFLAQLLLVPRQNESETGDERADDEQRIRIVLAVVISVLLVAFIALSSQYFADYLHLGTLSPRPFMTRRVNLLVVEPQDNSFPSFELALAAIFAVAMAFSSRKWGIAGAILTILLGLTRLFCGTNYLADVAVGALLGSGICLASGALLKIPLRVFNPKRGWQLGIGSAIAALTLAGSYISLASTPRFSAKLPLFWSSAATAATSEPELSAPPRTTRAARSGITEGEGTTESTTESVVESAPEVSTASSHGTTRNANENASAAPQPSAEELALSKRSHLFLPEVEKFLRGQLSPLARPFRLLDVEVAPVSSEKWSYRCAAIRFEISPGAPDLRRQTAEIAARLVKAALARDSQLQSVDVTAILRGDGAQIDGTSLRFAGDEVPVFTASILRENVTVKAPRWANDPKLDGGSWLRARSRLYINEKVLPALAPPTAPIVPSQIPKAVAPAIAPKTPVKASRAISKTPMPAAASQTAAPALTIKPSLKFEPKPPLPNQTAAPFVVPKTDKRIAPVPAPFKTRIP